MSSSSRIAIMMSRFALLGCFVLTGCQSQLLTRAISTPKENSPFFAPEQAQQVAYEAKLREREAEAKQHGGGKCACCK